MKKKCSKCGEEKELTEFRKENTKDGRGYYCKECCRKIDKENRKNRTPEQIEHERNQAKLDRQRRKQKTSTLNIQQFDFECSEQDGLDCKCCGKFFPHHCFKIDTRFKRGYSKKCVTCLGDVTQNIKKICSKCGEEKYLHQFRKNNLSPDGRQSTCCQCDAEKERELHKIPEVREKNKNKCSTYRQNHYDYDIKRCQDYKEENKEDLDEYSRKYNEENRDIVYARRKTPEARKKANERKKQRSLTDEQFRIKDCLRTRLYNSIKSGGSKKDKRSTEYGLDWNFVSDEMRKTKPNIEHPSIDHIVPCEAFDMTNDEHIRICFDIRNLRWCSKSENSSKNNYIIPNLIRKHNLIWITDFLGINLEEYEKENWRIAKYNKQEE